MTQYPYPTSGVTDTRIYKPRDLDDSSAPLNFSGDSTSRYPVDTSSPQVVTSASSFDDDQTAIKGRRPKKGKKGHGTVASVDEKQGMISIGYSSATSGSKWVSSRLQHSKTHILELLQYFPSLLE